MKHLRERFKFKPPAPRERNRLADRGTAMCRGSEALTAYERVVERWGGVYQDMERFKEQFVNSGELRQLRTTWRLAPSLPDG